MLWNVFKSNKNPRLFTGSSIMASGTDRPTTSFGNLFDGSLGFLSLRLVGVYWVNKKYYIETGVAFSA